MILCRQSYDVIGLPPSSGATPVAVICVSLFTTNAGESGRLGAVAGGGGVAVVVCATVQSSEPSLLVARMVRKFRCLPPWVPRLITRVPVLKAIPAGNAPTAAYVGVGVPLAAGTVTRVIATFCVHAWASPVSSAKAGAVSVPPAGSSVRVRVALLTDKVRTWLAKVMTSALLAGIHSYGSDISALPIWISPVSPSDASKMIRPVASNSAVKLATTATMWI